MQNFWNNLKKPFYILAPMDDVTDVVFRQIVSEVGRPDVFFTEFTNVDGLQSKGREALLPRLKFTKSQRPIVAQIWGKNPENYFKTAKELEEMGFDGIDINMGCPEKKVIKNGCCAALIENRKLAEEIIDAVKKGAPNTPISVKTRTGLSEVTTESWISFLLDQDLAAITLHARTARQMSKVPADWDQIKLAVELRDRSGKATKIVGNGDVKSLDEGVERARQTGCDGIMIGRGVFDNIWVFEKSDKIRTQEERLNLLLHHVELFENEWRGTKNFNILKKFFKLYTSGFERAASLREELMKTKSAAEVVRLLKLA